MQAPCRKRPDTYLILKQGKMSGPIEEVTAGETSHDDSSSRFKAAPAQGADFRQELSKQEPIGRLSLSSLTLPCTEVERLSECRDAYRGWIAGLTETLSPEGRRLIQTQAFDRLKGVPHSTIAHSGVMNHVDLTRWDHCIHAAHTVVALGGGGRLGLNPYEMKVVELVMLLHDPHRLGSHALDRVFASMPGAPKDFNRWWPADDYHEYHGACLVARDPSNRAALGKYYDDVLAILTYEDKRPQDLKDRDYGVLYPRLNAKRLASLHRLKDEIDRCSYLKLDYLRSGFKPSIIANAFVDVERHEMTLAARGSGIQLNIDEQSGPEPYNDVARLRYVYREKLATLPVGCLAERVIFHDGIWDKARGRYDARFMESPAFYEDIRDRAMRSDYESIFSGEALALLRAAKTGRGLCVEDVYAPLATMTFADLTEGAGIRALEECVPFGLSSSICGVPRRDMTMCEAHIRHALRHAGLGSNVHVLTSNDFGKTFEYDVSRKGEAPVKEVARNECHDSHIKVVIAAKAVDANGDAIDLSRTREVVTKVLRDSGYLKDPRVVDSFNARVFSQPVDATVFSETVRKKFEKTPKWIELGGCGLLPVS